MPNEILQDYKIFFDKTLALGTQHLASYLTHSWQLIGKALVSKGEDVADTDRYITPKSFNVTDFGVKDGLHIYGIEFPDCGIESAGKYGVIAYSEPENVRYYTLDHLAGDKFAITQWKKQGEDISSRKLRETDDLGLWGFVYAIRDIINEDMIISGSF